MAITLPFLKGTRAAYDAIATKDSGTVYFTIDDGGIFLGDVQMGGSGGVSGTVVQSVAFDETTQKFTFTYSDSSTQEIDLVLESVIQDISYSSTTKKLTLTLVSGATTEIDLTDLVDAYSGGTTDNVGVDVSGGVITATVNTVSAIDDTTSTTAIPNVGAVVDVLTIGTF